MLGFSDVTTELEHVEDAETHPIEVKESISCASLAHKSSPSKQSKTHYLKKCIALIKAREGIYHYINS